MNRFSRWLFRKAMLPLVSSRQAKQLTRWPAKAPRIQLQPEPLENRDVAGTLLDGFLLAGLGGVAHDPLSVMAGTFGESALVGPTLPPAPGELPLAAGVGTSSSPPTTINSASSEAPSGGAGTATETPPVGGFGWVALGGGAGFNLGAFSLADSSFGLGGFPSVFGGISVGSGGGASDSGGSTLSGPGQAAGGSGDGAEGGPSGGSTNMGGTGSEGEGGAFSGEENGGSAGFGLPGLGGTGGEWAGGGGSGEGGEAPNGGGNGGGALGPNGPSGLGTGGSGPGLPGGGGPGTGSGGIGGPGTGSPGVGNYDIIPDTTDIRKGQEVGFDVTQINGDPILTETVEWDFNYDGQTFQPEEGYEDSWAYFTFDTVGSRTIAARVTDVANDITIVTETFGVGHPRPIVITEEQEAVQSEWKTLVATAEDVDGNPLTEAAFSEIEWAVWSDELYDYEVDDFATSQHSLTPSTWFDNYGDAWVRVRVTDLNGEVGESEFYLWVANKAPQATVVYQNEAGAQNVDVPEGKSVKFVISDLNEELDLDNLDSLNVYADFTGSGEFGLIDHTEWTFHETSKTISFWHYYDDNPSNKAPHFTANIRVSDDWGYESVGSVNVRITNVAPTATLIAGERIATYESSGQEIWGMGPGDLLKFEDVTEPSVMDRAELKYVWNVRKLNGNGDPITQEWTPLKNAVAVSVESFDVGDKYEVQAFIEDKDSGKSVVKYFKIGVFRQKGRGSGSELATLLDTPVAPGERELLTNPLNGFGYERYVGGVQGGFGTFLPSTMPAAPAEYVPFAFQPSVVVDEIPANQEFSTTFRFDSSTILFAATVPGLTAGYTANITIYELQYTSSTEVTYQFHSQTTQTVSHGLPVGDAMTILVPGLPTNRRVYVSITPRLMNGEQVFRQTQTAYYVAASTPKEPPPPGFLETLSDVWRIVRDLGSQFGEMASSFFSTLTSGQFSNIYTNLTKGLPGAVQDFFGDLKTNLQQAFFTWLGGQENLLAGLPNFDVTSPRDLTTFLLKMSGLSWDRLQDIILDELGNGNVAALDEFITQVLGENRDLNDPRTMYDFLAEMMNKFHGLDGINFNWTTIKDEMKANVTTQIENAMTRAVPQVLAMFIPGAGMVKALYKGLTWLLENRQQIAAVFDKITASLNKLSLPPERDANGNYLRSEFQDEVLNVMRGASALLISFLASQFGLSKLPKALKKAVGDVPNKIEDALRKGLRSFAKKTGGGTAVKEKNGSLARNVINGQVMDEFTHNGVVYQLAITTESKGNAEIRIFEKATKKLVGKPLTESNFLDAESKRAFRELKAAADATQSKARKPAAGQVKPTPPEVRTKKLTLERERAEWMLEKAYAKCDLLNAGCFAAGTKLWTPQGYRNIEDIKPGESVYSRDEWDEAGEIVAKVVEDVFTRYTVVLHLHVGGQVIRTTGEHPFFVVGKGWTPANELRPGDRLACADRTTVAVEEVFNTGERELVYNLRVSDYHTYFVGDDGWGWIAWAHNAYQVLNATMTNVLKELRKDLNGVLSNNGTWVAPKVHTLDMTKNTWETFQTTQADPEERMMTSKSYIYFVIDGAANTPASERVVKVGKTDTTTTSNWINRFSHNTAYRYTAILGATWWIAAFEVPSGQTAAELEKQCRYKLWKKTSGSQHKYWLPGDGTPTNAFPANVVETFRPAKAKLPSNDPYGKAVRRVHPDQPSTSTFDIKAVLTGSVLANSDPTHVIDLNFMGSRTVLTNLQGNYIYFLESRKESNGTPRKILKVGESSSPYKRISDYVTHARFLGSFAFGYIPSGITAHIFKVDTILAQRQQQDPNFDVTDLEHELRLYLYNHSNKYRLPLDHAKIESVWRTDEDDNYSLAKYNG